MYATIAIPRNAPIHDQAISEKLTRGGLFVVPPIFPKNSILFPFILQSDPYFSDSFKYSGTSIPEYSPTVKCFFEKSMAVVLIYRIHRMLWRVSLNHADYIGRHH